jgi:D-glycero-alpha-D-manno-heptose-7-phosphate kinase
MIISSCPLRLSLGSADHEPFSSRFTGNALNFAINKRVYIIIRPRNKLEDSKYRISYSKTELCDHVDDIKLGTVREAIKMVGVDDPLEIIYISDTPTRLGLGTSSAMAIALLKGLMFHKNWGVSNELLAEYAYKLEREILQERGGFQDQYAVCFGGINYLEGQPYKVTRKPIVLGPQQVEDFQNHMLLVYTGNKCESSVVLADQLTKLAKGVTLDETHRIKRMVKEMHAMMLGSSFVPADLSFVMKEAWELKKNLSSSMTGPCVERIEQIVNEVNPSAGLRLVGGGGDRGVVLIITAPEFKEEIKKRVLPNKSFDVTIDWEGVTVRRIFGR